MTTREGISLRSFASLIGVTENAVRSRIKSGKRIAEAAFADGSLDQIKALQLWYSDFDLSRAPATRRLPMMAAREAGRALKGLQDTFCKIPTLHGDAMAHQLGCDSDQLKMLLNAAMTEAVSAFYSKGDL